MISFPGTDDNIEDSTEEMAGENIKPSSLRKPYSGTRKEVHQEFHGWKNSQA